MIYACMCAFMHVCGGWKTLSNTHPMLSLSDLFSWARVSLDLKVGRLVIDQQALVAGKLQKSCFCLLHCCLFRHFPWGLCLCGLFFILSLSIRMWQHLPHCSLVFHGVLLGRYVLFYLLAVGYLGSFYFVALLNNVVYECCLSLCTCFYFFWVYIPGRGVAGSYANSMFTF